MQSVQQRYIDLMKAVLTDLHRVDHADWRPIRRATTLSWKARLLLAIDRILEPKGYGICKETVYRREDRLVGRDWPPRAETMIGIQRLENLEACIREVVGNGVPGDFIETGVWRGGATLFMKAMLTALDERRTIWIADSFAGLPEPDAEKYAADAGDRHHTKTELAVSQEEVMANFERYGLLDGSVRFLKGWFRDTLPTAPIERLAILRLDGDMYESTMDGLVHLYPKLSPGGFLIVDDWGAVEGCRLAVEDYRKEHAIEEEIVTIDWTGVYWKKAAPG